MLWQALLLLNVSVQAGGHLFYSPNIDGLPGERVQTPLAISPVRLQYIQATEVQHSGSASALPGHLWALFDLYGYSIVVAFTLTLL